MERIALLHSRLELTIVAVLVVLMLWGLFCAWRSRVSQGYLAAIWVVQLLIIAQSLLGLLQLFAGAPLGRLGLHLVYGAVALACLPAALLYNRGRTGRWEALVFAAACLFLLGVVLRSFETAA